MKLLIHEYTSRVKKQLERKYNIYIENVAHMIKIVLSIKKYTGYLIKSYYRI